MRITFFVYIIPMNINLKGSLHTGSESRMTRSAAKGPRTARRRRRRRTRRRKRHHHRRRRTRRRRKKRRSKRTKRRRKNRRRGRRGWRGWHGGAAVASAAPPCAEIKYQLFTDMDDTVHGSGRLAPFAGRHPGPRSKFFPCVRKLHEKFGKICGLPTVIVSANPMPKGKKRRELLEEQFGAKIEVFTGEWWSGMKSLWGNYNDMAKVKIGQITQKVNEEIEKAERGKYLYRAIWIGDNGQGDLIAAEKLLEGGIIFAAFIHHVVDDKPETCQRKKDWGVAVGIDRAVCNLGRPPRAPDPKCACVFPFKKYSDIFEVLKTFPGLEGAGLEELENACKREEAEDEDKKKGVVAAAGGTARKGKASTLGAAATHTGAAEN